LEILLDWTIKIFTCYPLISPTGVFTLFWSIFMIVSVVSTLFIYPIDIIMGLEDMKTIYGQKWQAFNFFIIVIYISDILVSFNTSVFNKGILITDKREIFMHYLKTSFIYDVLVLLPFFCEVLEFKE